MPIDFVTHTRDTRWLCIGADDADFSGVNDPHVISGLLKLFLRKEQETPLNFALVSGNSSDARGRI